MQVPRQAEPLVPHSSVQAESPMQVIVQPPRGQRTVQWLEPSHSTVARPSRITVQVLSPLQRTVEPS